MESLKGKCLIRKANGADGQTYIVIAGVFIPSEPLDSFSDMDEMWAVELGVIDVIKFEGQGTGFHGSPEDFLQGKGQNPAEWRKK